jgi:hypothetical protein
MAAREVLIVLRAVVSLRYENHYVKKSEASAG